MSHFPARRRPRRRNAADPLHNTNRAWRVPPDDAPQEPDDRAPDDVPSDTPPGPPDTPPADAPPDDTPSDASPETPDQAPPDAPDEPPADAPDDRPSDAPAEPPIETPPGIPAADAPPDDTPAEPPAETPSQPPAEPPERPLDLMPEPPPSAPPGLPTAPEPPQPPPPPEPPKPAPEKPSTTASLYTRLVAYIPPEKRALVGGGALVVAIVLVILLLAGRPRYRVVGHLPKHLASLSVARVADFLDSAAYKALNDADHDVAKALDEHEEQLDLDLRRDVVLRVQFDRTELLFGRFRRRRIASAFEELNEGGAGNAAPDYRTRYVEGHPYQYCIQTGIALTTVGSSIACIGNRNGVRRFLKVRSGLYPDASTDEAFAAAYDDRLARRATVYRYENKAGSLLRMLRPLFGITDDDVDKGVLVSAFYALALHTDSLELNVRIAAKDKESAARFKANVEKAPAAEGAIAPLAALKTLIGAEKDVAVTQAEALLAFRASVPLKSFAAIAKKNKQDPDANKNLILSLIAK